MLLLPKLGIQKNEFHNKLNYINCYFNIFTRMIKKTVTSILIFICFFCHANKNDDTLKIDRLIRHLRLQINQKSGKSNYETILMHVKLSGLYNRINLYDSAYSIINRYLKGSSKPIENLTEDKKEFNRRTEVIVN